MDKGNSFYFGQTVFFATKHGKEEILSPLFREMAMVCERVDVDTDQFGTFSGEVERTGSIRETLRKKIHAAAKSRPQDRLFLASEGSFGPHPVLGFIQSDLESLLFWDRQTELEIYAEYLCPSPVHAEAVLGPLDDYRSFLEKVPLPDHSVIVRPEGLFEPIAKGLMTRPEIEQAMLNCFCSSTNGKVVIATDLRAHKNQTRRRAIEKAGRALIEKLSSFCPACGIPGYSVSSGVPGLKCESCGEPSEVAGSVIWECAKCGKFEERPRPDGKTSLPVEECPICNP